MELMRSFIDNTENQIKESIQRYRDKVGTTVREENLGEGADFSTRIHQGLDDETWDLDTIFETHFPNLQRRSALITVFSFLENELDELCRLCQEEQSLKIAIKDISGKGIERATTYLDKIVGINTGRSAPIWRELTSIQKVRNIIVHQNGKLGSIQGERNAEIDRFIGENPNLSGRDEVLILEGFLQQTLDKIDQYFKLLSKSIEERGT